MNQEDLGVGGRGRKKGICKRKIFGRGVGRNFWFWGREKKLYMGLWAGAGRESLNRVKCSKGAPLESRGLYGFVVLV